MSTHTLWFKQKYGLLSMNYHPTYSSLSGTMYKIIMADGTVHKKWQILTILSFQMQLARMQQVSHFQNSSFVLECLISAWLVNNMQAACSGTFSLFFEKDSACEPTQVIDKPYFEPRKKVCSQSAAAGQNKDLGCACVLQCWWFRSLNFKDD